MPRPNTGPKLVWLPQRGAYYIRWYDRGTKRVRSTHTADRRAAEKALAFHIADSHRLTGQNDPQDVGVAEALAHYLEHHAPNTADPARIAYAVDALMSFWSEKSLADITPVTCQAYVEARGVAPGTVRRELATLTAAQSFIKKEGLLNNIVPATLPDKPPPKDRWLTRDEVARLLRATSERHLRLFIRIGLYTGARKEAILSLTWDRVDLVGGRINFARPGVAQTKKRRAHIPIPQKLVGALRRANRDGSYVIHINGEPIKRIDKGFRAAVQRAGLVGVSPHTLRHTCGTWLAQAGVPMWEIAGWLGQDPETTARIYAHHHPDYMQAARSALDRKR